MFNFPTTKDAGKNPRVVRVPRNFRGKDRHTKVTTMRGVRDRRIRLSAPTAIQLYDLQERLGLGQPSKVVDWLLEVARNSIDNLPPLAVSMAQPTSTTLDHHHHLRFCDQVTPNMLASYNNFNYTSIWDHPPSTLSLSRFGGGFSVMPQAYDEENNKSRSLTHATTSANMAASPSIFTPFFSLDGTESMEIDYEHSTRFNSFEF